MQRLYLILTGVAALLLSFTGVSAAASVIDPKDGSMDLMQSVYNAFNGGHYAYAAAIALVLAVALCRKYLGTTWQWMHSDAGAAALVFLGSLGAALASSLAGGGALTLHLTGAALAVACSAAGGYAAIKKIVIMPLVPRLPSWLQAPVLWLFQHDGDATQPPVDQPLPAAQSAQ